MHILPTLARLAMIESPNTPMDENTNDPVGTGPYILAEFTPAGAATAAPRPRATPLAG